MVCSLRGEFKLREILAAVQLSKSTYMYWQKRFDREDSDLEILEEIKIIRAKHSTWGYRRIAATLQKTRKINKKKVQRICQKFGIESTTYSSKSGKFNSYKGSLGYIPNRLRRRFTSIVVHQKIVTDTTEFKYIVKGTDGKRMVRKAYLDPFMDLFNREIISFVISKRPALSNVMKALREAVQVTNDCMYRRTFHSDQGWAYQLPEYKNELKKNHIFQSMSRKGNCHDNAVIENFFGMLKQEIYYRKIYNSFEELKEAIEKYIKDYNEERIKDRLAWLSPVEYRQTYAAEYLTRIQKNKQTA